MTLHSPFPRPDLPAECTSHVAVTLRLADPTSDLLVRHIRILRDCVALAQKRWFFDIEAAVVLPGELQLLCKFPDAQFTVGGAMRLIAAAFARHAPTATRTTTGDIWANESEVIEISAAIARLRGTFIENAPVRAGLVKSAADWPYSSAHKGAAQADEFGMAVA